MSLDRRRFLNVCSSLGFASTLLPGVLYSFAADGREERVTAEMIDQAALFSGVPIAPDQKAAMLAALNSNIQSFEQLRTVKLPNSLPPAFIFDPLPPRTEANAAARRDRPSQAIAYLSRTGDREQRSPERSQ